MSILSFLSIKSSFKIFIFILVFSGSPILHAQDWGNWKKIETDTVNQSVFKNKKNRRADPLFPVFLRYYQQNVSPRQGTKCPASPSCSNFTMQSMGRFGFAIGFIMGLDRIYFRENFDMKYLKHYLPVVLENNTTRVYDPVEANYIFSKKDWRVIDPDFSSANISR